MNMDADAFPSSLSKRSFAQVASATLSCLHRSSRCNNNASVVAPAFYHDGCDTERVLLSPFKRRTIRKSTSFALATPSTSTMPIQTSAPSHPDSFPSFMSVFGGISSRFTPEKDEGPAPLQPLRVPSSHGSTHPSRRPLPFRHRESVSSMTSGSTDSSPTTTISTFDSPSAPDTSPSSSPESPSSMPYPKFMQPTQFGEQKPAQPAQSQSQQQNESLKPSESLKPVQPESPNRRARNLKNLSLRMPPPLDSSRPPIATASVVETTSHHFSAPPSPVIPPKTGRRKPAGLTIRTPGFDKSFSSNITEVVPPTPSLRHAESSPSLHSVFSPSFGPKGGMQLPRPVTHHGVRRPSEGCFTPLQTVPDENSHAGGALHDLQEEEDHLDSRESLQRNERGYPDGPIRIYDSGVYLYLEPTAQEASQFDVVVNVAKEVANPFTKSPESDTVMSAWRNSISAAIGEQHVQNDSRISSSKPEYIHVSWDHNSEILDDLYPLCELIESRISQGKKVLIHCQLGASRSASLVIAYGLFKNRELDFNSMYEMVKARSRWVGPNMSLIYQLTDFRSRLIRGTLSKKSPEEWSLASTPKSEVPAPSLAASPELPDNGQSMNHAPPVPPVPSLSVPSDQKTLRPSSPGFSKTLSHKRSLPPRPLPLRQMYHTAEPADRPQRPRTSYVQPVKKGSFVREQPELSSIFSPRTTEFMVAPLPRQMGGIGGVLSGDVADPRSPPPGNERLIMRSIDEFL
ncbi:putative protein-tyrosine phosphatase [Aspergillus chevalieri]|uniref:protein-tyrosine-phosphatase n=1 Tax=Aspergillus chevalieri TaxID=182096 RepID=A0A7R7VK79_ASPCH|nr:uncharacterized protein ACHE_20802S [Aspergillus chevalieri]BCR85344.1 hypothetical protein ACHE_20802S [Aspergillus chevalieri]